MNHPNCRITGPLLEMEVLVKDEDSTDFHKLINSIISSGDYIYQTLVVGPAIHLSSLPNRETLNGYSCHLFLIDIKNAELIKRWMKDHEDGSVL